MTLDLLLLISDLGLSGGSAFYHTAAVNAARAAFK
jgi:hypothetical protein